jgi:hypothetical protein
VTGELHSLLEISPAGGKHHYTVATKLNNPERTLDSLSQGGNRPRHHFQNKITRLQLHRITTAATTQRPRSCILGKLLPNSLKTDASKPSNRRRNGTTGTGLLPNTIS